MQLRWKGYGILFFWSDDSVQGVVSNTDFALKVRRVAQTKITDYFKN